MLLLLLGCTADEIRSCEGYADPELLGEVENEDLDEASGLAVSRNSAELLWSHNDQGDTARIFALGLDGEDRGVWTLIGPNAVDFEDIALDADDQLVVGDIGDNSGSRESVTLYRFPEPDVADNGGTISPESFELRYADGEPRDAEALVVDPLDGSIYVFEKVTRGAVGVYRADLDQGLLEAVTEVDLPIPGQKSVTAADFTPDGDKLLLRTREVVLVYSRGDDQSITELLAGTPCDGPLATEDQGEAIGAASWGYVTLSEGAASPLYRYNRR